MPLESLPQECMAGEKKGGVGRMKGRVAMTKQHSSCAITVAGVPMSTCEQRCIRVHSP